MTLIRLAVLAGLVLLMPLMIVLSLRKRRSTAFDALHERAQQIWQTSAHEALALVRASHEQLVAEGAFDMKKVAIAPFGTFGLAETISTNQFLYRCELAFGNYEEALAVSSALAGRVELTILQQVDCLVALGRRTEAIALLERNLDVDGWRGTLRRRLVELGGRPLRAVN